MKSRGRVLLGLGLAVAMGIALPVLLSAKSNAEDMRVKVETNRFYEILSKPGSDRALVEVNFKNISSLNLITDGEPGLNLTTWTKVYGESYVREVTWPTLMGPFHAEADYVCGYNLQLGAGLFDTTGAGSGLQKLVHDRIASFFPYSQELQSGIVVSLPALESSSFRVELENGLAKLAINLRFADATILDVSVPVRLVSKNGTPRIERVPNGQIVIRFEGRSRDSIIEQARAMGGGIVALGGCGAGVLFGGPVGCLIGGVVGFLGGDSYGESKANAEIPERARDLVVGKIDEVLGQIALGLGHLSDPFHPFKDRSGDEIRLRLESNPSVDPLGITLPLCVKISVVNHKVEANIPGPVALGANRIAHQKLASSASLVGLTLNGDAINQLIYYTWQAGLLKSVGESTMVLDSLTESVRMAAFDFTGFSPGLPPTLVPSLATSPGLPFVFGNVKVGLLSNKTVVGHGVAILELAQVGEVIELSGRLGELHANCVSREEGAGIRLSPCMSDLLPVVREMAATGKPPSHRFRGPEILAKLPQLGFQGLVVHLSDLHVASTSVPLGILITANAKIE